jgi:alpha-galactosidase
LQISVLPGGLPTIGSETLRIALIGAGSRSFGPGTVSDILLSEPLRDHAGQIVLMDTVDAHLSDSTDYARWAAGEVGSPWEIAGTTELEDALAGADFVVTAIEVDRYRYWCQDFHVPRMYGSRQVYGENGGVGGIFHALRNMGPMVEIARAMERLCPEAQLLNFTNPESKLCEAVCRLTDVRCTGLCHGVAMGRDQIARILQLPVERLETAACGLNHFTWFQTIRDRETGDDLYPALREAERRGDWLCEWDELALGRVLLRRFGLWPSPAGNHYGEYIRWAGEFIADEIQYFYDPADGHPWETGHVPEFVYSLSGSPTSRPWVPAPAADEPGRRLRPSGELAVPIMEALSTGLKRELGAINVPNAGAVPNLPDKMVVEVPGVADGAGLRAVGCEPLPEAIAAMIRLQGSIHKLIVQAFAEGSRDKLVQAVLLDPSVDSYRGAIAMVDELCRLQAEMLPVLRRGDAGKGRLL